jgi:hypothetical protein
MDDRERIAAILTARMLPKRPSARGAESEPSLIRKPIVKSANHILTSFQRSKCSSRGIGSPSFKILVSDHQIEH